MIEQEYEVFLNHLFKAEGGKLHYNSKEVDVTNSYGIYRHMHPNAEIWTYIDSIALTVTKAPSKAWSKEQIDAINSKIDKVKEKELSYKLYKQYLSDIDLTMLPKDLVLAVVDAYTNTPLGALLSLQEAINDCDKYKLFKAPSDIVRQKNGNLLLVDGKFGSTSKKAMLAFKAVADDKSVLIFKNCLLLRMTLYYMTLVVDSPDKNLRNGKGWINRMEASQHI